MRAGSLYLIALAAGYWFWLYPHELDFGASVLWPGAAALGGALADAAAVKARRKSDATSD